MIETIDHAELMHKIADDQDFILINVLPEDYFKMSHIPGSFNAPAEAPSFVNTVQSFVKNTNKNIIVYCTNESCTASEIAAKKLIDAGYQNVSDFSGGMQEWHEAGGRLVSSMDKDGCGSSCGC